MAYPCNNVRTGVYFSVTEKNGSVPLCSKNRMIQKDLKPSGITI